MHRSARPKGLEVQSKRAVGNTAGRAAQAEAQAKRLAAKKTPKREGSEVRALEKRLAEALKQQAETVEQQAATSEILRVISASPADVRPVLDAVAERAALLCKAPFARVLLVDGERLRAAAEYSVDGTVPARSTGVPLTRSSITGRAILDRTIIHHADIHPLLDTEFPEARENGRRLKFRAVLAVPLMHEDCALGAIFLWRREPRLFAPQQVALVATFAHQAAIAIDHARLFNETREALERQTATSEILRVISTSPPDVQPVFDTIVRRARVLCDASFSGVFLVDAETLSLPVADGLTPDDLALFASGFPRKLGRDTVTGRAALECRVVQTPDLINDSEYSSAPGSRVGARTVLGVPLMRDGKAIGAIGVWRREVRPFSEKQIALLQTFADQAVIAIENVRLFKQTSEALDQQTATSDILRVISSSPTNVRPVFDAIVRSAVQLCGASHCLIFQFDGEFLWPGASYGISPGFTDYWKRNPIRPGPGTISGRAALSRRTAHAHDVVAESGYEHPEAQKMEGYRTVLSVPMLKDETLVGVITAWRTKVEPFTDKQVGLVETFAEQAVIAIENVRLFTELSQKNHALTQAHAQVSGALDRQTATRTSFA